MTAATENIGGATYLGFDFGTSTSSLCYVDASDIKEYTTRALDKAWRELNELIEVLPYPAAHPLARFISETSVEQMDRWGREALEGMLTVSAFLVYAEQGQLSAKTTGYFKTLRQRSAGPLWGMLKNCWSATGTRWQIARGLAPLFEAPFLEELNEAVSKLAETKHGKIADGLDYPRVLRLFGNILAKCFEGKVLGFFEEARRKPFSMKEYCGIFRAARGPSAPFVDVYEFEGPEAFPSEFVFLFDIQAGFGVSMYPLFVRGLDRRQRQIADDEVYMFDIAKAAGREIGYRAVQERPGTSITAEGDFAELFSSVSRMLETDVASDIVRGVTLRSRSL